MAGRTMISKLISFRQSLINAVFFGGFHHCLEIFYISIIDAGSTGEYKTYSGAAIFNKLAAVFLYLYCRAFHNYRSGYITHDTTNITQCLLGFRHISLIEPPDDTPPIIDPPIQTPEIPDDDETVTISVNVTDADTGLPPDGVTLSYRIDGGTWNNVTMSKTTGNIIDPFDLVQRFGSDAVRYFFLREGAFGADWDYTDQSFIRRYNADLANDFGNLLNRTLQMVVRYFDGVVPPPSDEAEAVDENLMELAGSLGARVADCVHRLALQEVLTHVWDLVEQANRYVQETSPWELAKARKAGSPQAGERLATVLYNLVDVLRLLGYCLVPVIPNKAEELLKQLGLDFDLGAGWQNLTAVGVYAPGTHGGAA